MTQQRRDNNSTEFGIWLRQQKALSSSLGYVGTNLDYIWENRLLGRWMLIEEKRNRAQPLFYQVRNFERIDRLCRRDPAYAGLYYVVFENTCPDDGRVWINKKLASAQTLMRLLKEFKLEST